ncbi:putative UDP-rhamnose:rhamnosyltransferase 1 [Salvia miltiorrhiza]|uniref:putative UDP-rhamnose:rhamnosyltransferase 1 n=1 Tax=Salvia miltiorrhiza TaxID=226208 RepID=UPI0025AC3A0B|nr:putative UDP-rhamnose:rhamnosyltransferase 1 [Salvia miltiorrhiza]
MEAKTYHIMMFPWLAFGHMIPFFELSKRLAAKGIFVSYVSTPRNLQRLPPIPSALQAKMELLEIQMHPVDGLPENCEATIDIQNVQMPFLKKAHDMLAEPFDHLLEKVRPDLILVDFAAYRISEVAAMYGVSTAYFSVFTAATLAYMGPPAELKDGKSFTSPECYTKPPDWIPFPSRLAHTKEYAALMMRNTHVPDASGVSSGQRLAKVVEESSFVLVRSCKEFEGKYLNLIRELYQKPVLPIGLLTPIPEESKNVPIDSSWPDTCKWLDGKEPKSVLFVGFGSEYKMPLEEIHELAFSLELSRLPFLWILRKPQGVDSLDLLPPGFASRTLRQGLVVLGWAPQQEILAHPAIGGCFFHSGWGTSVESLAHGHPLILLPMVSDQGLTAKLLVENQVGYEVPRNEDGSFSRDVVAESIRRVLLEEEGEQLRLKAAELKSVFGNHESQDNYISKFIDHLRNIMINKQV